MTALLGRGIRDMGSNREQEKRSDPFVRSFGSLRSWDQTIAACVPLLVLDLASGAPLLGSGILKDNDRRRRVSGHLRDALHV